MYVKWSLWSCLLSSTISTSYSRSPVEIVSEFSLFRRQNVSFAPWSAIEKEVPYHVYAKKLSFLQMHHCSPSLILTFYPAKYLPSLNWFEESPLYSKYVLLVWPYITDAKITVWWWFPITSLFFGCRKRTSHFKNCWHYQSFSLIWPQCDNW